MRRILLLFFSFLAVLSVQAGNVSRSAALQKAQQFMQGKQLTAVQMQGTTRGDASDGSQYYYIFNAEDNGGFVIVSGDDRTTPILGYSDKGHIDLNLMPSNMKAWLEGYVKQLKSLTDDYQPEARTRAGNMPAIPPLIKTQWNQSAPYNLNCPIDGGKQCVTGCTATALAQVMYYWQYPASAIPSVPAYTTEKKKINLPELPSTTFKWDKMKPIYNGDEADESATAVAELMRYIGQAVKMDYTAGESSGAVDLSVMHKIFGYSINARRVWRASYTTSNWEELVYSELAANRPVLYDGSSLTGGHQFICDGYDGKGLFHLNWGWGGYCDSYFILSLANPDDQGIGGGSDPGGYKFDQTAIIGFQPGSDSEKEIPILDGYMNEAAPDSYSRASVDQNFENVSLNGYVWIFFKGVAQHVTADLGYGLFKDGEFLKVLAYDNVTTSSADGGEYAYNNLKVSFGASLNGHYSICPIYRFSEADSWMLCSSSGLCGYIADITATSLTLKKASDNADFTVGEVVVPSALEKGTPVSMEVPLTNTGDTNQEVVYLWTKTTGSWALSTKAVGSIEPGKTGTVILTFTPNEAGTVSFKITSDEKGTIEKYSGLMTVADVIEANIDNYVYRLNTTTKVAVLKKLYDRDAEKGDITIPATVTYDANTYNVKEIAASVFWNLGITGLKISEGIERIGKEAFRYCYSLTNMELPSTLTSIGDYAFGNNTRLQSIQAKMVAPFIINENVFGITDKEGTTPSPATLYVPIGSKAKYQATVGWKKFFVVYEGELKEAIVGNLRYSYVTGDKIATVLPKTDNYYEDNYSGNWLNNLTIPSSVNIDGVDYRVVAIVDYAFWNRNDIRNLVISRGIETIGASAFIYCYGMQTIELPVTLTSIGDNAFGDVSSYTINSHIVTPFVISKNVFGTNNGGVIEAPSTTLKVPAGCKAKYEALEGWNIFPTIEEVVSTDTRSVSISKNGQATLYSDQDLDFTDVEGLKAYVVIGNDKNTGTIWLSRVKRVAAGTPLLLRGEQGNYNVPISDVAAVSYYKNMLKGVSTDITIYKTDGDYTNYYSGSGTHGVGFYAVSDAGMTIGAGKAYLPLPTSITPVGTAGSTVQITIGEKGQTTFCSDNSLDFSSVADKDVKAFVVTGYDKSDGTIWLSRINEVPAGTGILIRGPKGTYDVKTTSSQSYYENMLKGTLSATTIGQTDGGFTNYYLSLSGAHGPGFYRVNQDELTVGAGKAYLQIPSSLTRAGDGEEPDAFNLKFDEDPESIISLKVYSLGGINGEDGTTGVNEVISEEVMSDQWYDLQGRRIDRPTKPGLYILNGKKVVIK